MGGGVVRVSSVTSQEFRLKGRGYVAERRIQRSVEGRIGIGSGDRRAAQEDASEPGFANCLDEGRAVACSGDDHYCFWRGRIEFPRDSDGILRAATPLQVQHWRKPVAHEGKLQLSDEC